MRRVFQIRRPRVCCRYGIDWCAAAHHSKMRIPRCDRVTRTYREIEPYSGYSGGKGARTCGVAKIGGDIRKERGEIWGCCSLFTVFSSRISGRIRGFPIHRRHRHNLHRHLHPRRHHHCCHDLLHHRHHHHAWMVSWA